MNNVKLDKLIRELRSRIKAMSNPSNMDIHLERSCEIALGETSASESTVLRNRTQLAERMGATED